MTQLFFSPAAESAPAAEQPIFFQQPQTMSPDERLCAVQHGAPTLEEACYNELDSALLDQLIERSELWAMISDPSFTLSMPPGFEQGPDNNSTSVNADMNFNQNIGSYTQDFSHYNDLQFNMLVNENQTLQSEAQDSPSSVVQVKIEEEL